MLLQALLLRSSDGGTVECAEAAFPQLLTQQLWKLLQQLHWCQLSLAKVT